MLNEHEGNDRHLTIKHAKLNKNKGLHVGL